MHGTVAKHREDHEVPCVVLVVVGIGIKLSDELVAPPALRVNKGHHLLCAGAHRNVIHLIELETDALQINVAHSIGNVFNRGQLLAVPNVDHLADEGKATVVDEIHDLAVLRLDGANDIGINGHDALDGRDLGQSLAGLLFLSVHMRLRFKILLHVRSRHTLFSGDFVDACLKVFNRARRIGRSRRNSRRRSHGNRNESALEASVHDAVCLMWMKTGWIGRKLDALFSETETAHRECGR